MWQHLLMPFQLQGLSEGFTAEGYLYYKHELEWVVNIPIVSCGTQQNYFWPMLSIHTHHLCTKNKNKNVNVMPKSTSLIKL